MLDLAQTAGRQRRDPGPLESEFGGNAAAAEGIARLRQLLDVAARRRRGRGAHRARPVDLRGLDYYTGTIYETFLTTCPRSAASAPAAATTTWPGCTPSSAARRRRLARPGPAAGGDGGAEHAAEDGDAGPGVGGAVRCRPPGRLPEAWPGRCAAEGIGAEVYPDAKKIGQQLKYAEGRGFRVALIAGGDEFARGVWKVKDLANARKRRFPILAWWPR